MNVIIRSPSTICQIGKGIVFRAAIEPTEPSFEAAMQELQREKPKVAEALRARPQSMWAHHAAAQNTVIMTQTTSNVAESTMHMVGPEVNYDSYNDHGRLALVTV